MWKSLLYMFKVSYLPGLHFLERVLFDIEFEFDIVIMFTVSYFNSSMLHVCVQSEIDQYLAALHSAGCDLAAVQYVRRWK